MTLLLVGQTSVARRRARSKILLLPRVKPDPAYIGLRLEGLARLVECAADGGPDVNPINGDAAFFISSELEQIAKQLSRL